VGAPAPLRPLSCRRFLSPCGPSCTAWASQTLTTIDASDAVSQQAGIRRWLSEVPQLRGDIALQRRLLVEARDLYRAKGHLPYLGLTEQLLSQIIS